MFGRKKKNEKELNVATTPEGVEIKHKPNFKWSIFFLLINIFSIALYSCYTFFVTLKLTEKTFLSKLILYLLILYAVVFVLLILISLGNKNKMKSRIKNYKSAVKFLKYLIRIINIVLSIITAISAFITTGTTNISAILYAILSLFVTFILIIMEIAAIIVRKNIPLIKQNFLEIRDKGNNSIQREN